MNIAVCKPTYFDINYSINPWMNSDNPPNKIFNDQWETLIQTIIKCGGVVKYIQPKEGLPDMTFVDCGLIIGNVIIPSNFLHSERQNEVSEFLSFFLELGYKPLFVNKMNSFEGHGDTLWSDKNTLYIGHGIRTSLEGVQEIQRYCKLKHSDITIYPIRLVSNRFFHLDTCFCPLDNSTAMVYSKAISQEGIKIIYDNFKNVIEVCDEDAFLFACNCLVLGKNVIMPKVKYGTDKNVESYGFNVHQVDVSEFIKAGGACKCLSFIL